jgi:hypothetical protein
MGCVGRQARHTVDARPPSRAHTTRRWWIDLEMGRFSARVELPRLVAVRAGGVDLVRLDELWSAARLGMPATTLLFDFVADDGSHLGSTGDGCVDGRVLSTGYVAVATRDLVWTPSPARPPSWFLEHVARVVATPRGSTR